MVRIGVLGAAWILPDAILKPVAYLKLNGTNVSVDCIACRDKQKAQAYAASHAIPRFVDSYEQLIADPDIDLIYIPLPNNLHHKWAIQALQNNKHVLCEKPFASNAEQAREMIEVAKNNGKLIVEAFHYRFHPSIIKLGKIVSSGELGTINHVETSFCVPILRTSDIRYNWDLAGGSLMDTGSYAVNCMRYLAQCGVENSEPIVTNARATLQSPNIDKHMEAEFEIHRKSPSEDAPITGKIRSSIRTFIPKASVTVNGSKADLYMFNFVVPHFYHKITVFDKETKTSRVVEQSSLFSVGTTTYSYQLEAMINAIEKNDISSIPYPPEDAIANMETIDNIYLKANLPKRQ